VREALGAVLDRLMAGTKLEHIDKRRTP